MRVHLSRPDITEKEINAVVEVLKSPNLSLGPKLPQFEKAFCDYIGRKYAIAVNSGTSGLFLCLAAMGIGEGDEVITTPFTFIASATCIMMTGATPVFTDIDEKTMNIDPADMERKITSKTKAILPVEVFGNPARFDEICSIGRKHGLKIVEDCCEALGSEFKGQKAGTFGDTATFAFYPNKQITTGEGGMILTDDENIADMCFSLRNQGRGKGGGWLAHERLGYNYRLSDINCALGIVQLSRLDEIKAKRQRAAAYYQDALADESRITLPKADENCDMNWFVFVIRLNNDLAAKRDELLKLMTADGIGVNNYFAPLHLQPFIAEKYGCEKGDYPLTEKVAKSTIALPFYSNLTRDEVGIVADTLKKNLDKIS